MGTVRLAAGFFVTLFAVALGTALLTAQAPPDAPRIWSGVYTAEQAASGEATYEQRCAGCHRADLKGGQTGANFAPALGGEDFLLRWDSTSVNRIYRIIRDQMPRGTPGILGEGTSRDLVAYILKFNGFPAGTTALPADEAALDAIAIVPRPGSARTEVANFAPVQVVGCVTRGSAGWLLTRGTDAAPSTNAPPPQSGALGAQTYRLVSVAPYALERRTGHMVQAKGLIRRDPDETLITLTAVETISENCAR